MNKKRVVSTLFLYLLIFSLGCDFESPQKWEKPSWYLPLTVPLINTVYSFDGIAQDSTIIEDSLNNTLKIIFSNNIADEGARPGIDENIFDFKLPGESLTDLINQDFSDIGNFPPTAIPGTEIIFDIPLVSFTSDPTAVAASGCIATSDLDQPILSEFPAEIKNTYEIISLFSSELSTFQINGTPIIDSLHLITISEGNLGVRVVNNYPFPVKKFNLQYVNYEYGGTPNVLRNIEFQDIAGYGVDPREIQGNIGAGDDSVQFGDSLKIELSIELDISDDYVNLDPEIACPIFSPTEYGWDIDPSEVFTIELYFNIPAASATDLICTTNKIEVIDIVQTIPISIEGLDMDIKGGKIKDTTSQILDNELNYAKLVSSSTLFAPPVISINYKNFYSNVSGEDVSLELGGPIPTTGIDTVYDASLDDYYLGTPGYPDSVLKEIAIGINVSIEKISRSPIIIGSPMNLKISQLLMAETELAYLTAVTYDMDFDTPSSDIEGIPQGGVGLQFYDVQLIMDLYTQIGIPIQLDMNLKGLKGEESMIALIDPELNVPVINTVGDSVRTIITLNKDGQKVEWYHMDNLDGDIPDTTIFTPIDEEVNSIVDIMNFAPEKIEFGGGAKINGAGFLAPNSFLWGTFTLVAPLAFVFEEPVNILPAAPTEMAPMAPSTAQQIDSALVEATLNVTITNSSPLGGNLSLLISDSTIFPLFLDSLITETWLKQKYVFNTTIWDTLRPDLTDVIDSVSVISIDSTDENTKALEVKFYRDDTLQFFIGRMFELGFPRADSIEYHLGYVNPEFPNIHTSSISIDSVRMDWMFTDEPRYNISMMTFDSSPIQFITDTDTAYIPLTFQTTNTIGVQAYFTLMLDAGVLGRDSNSNDK